MNGTICGELSDLNAKESTMFLLQTPRLVLVATPLEVLQARLERDSFSADVPVGQTTMHVSFPPEWPGDALVMFPTQAAHYNADDWGGTLIDRAAQVAVGQIGTKGQHDINGDIEIGYGINPTYWGRGYASEAVAALVAFLLAQPTVRRVLAETRTDNAGSMRVLEKNGFSRIGERVDDEDGPLFIWARE